MNIFVEGEIIMKKDFIIPFEEIDDLYMKVNERVEKIDMPHYILAIQQTLFELYNDENMSQEEMSAYFVKNILPNGNVQVIYQMLVEEAHRDVNILDVRNIVQNEINSIFNEDVANATIDDLKEDFESLDYEKLKDLLKIFVAVNQ